MSSSYRDIFIKTWKTKFFDQKPPELSCLLTTPQGDLDISTVEKNLQKCNETIASLNRQLREQEFIASFLWDLIHGVTKNVQPSNNKRNSGKPKKLSSNDVSLFHISELDNAVPVQEDSNSLENSPQYLEETIVSGNFLDSKAAENISEELDQSIHSLDDYESIVDTSPLHKLKSKRAQSLDFDFNVPSKIKPVNDKNIHSKKMSSPRYEIKSALNTIIQSNLTGLKPDLTGSKPDLSISNIESDNNVCELIKPKPIPTPRSSLLKPHSSLQTALSLLPLNFAKTNTNPTVDEHNIFNSVEKKSNKKSFKLNFDSNLLCNQSSNSSVTTFKPLVPPALPAKPQNQLLASVLSNNFNNPQIINDQTSSQESLISSNNNSKLKQQPFQKKSDFKTTFHPKNSSPSKASSSVGKLDISNHDDDDGHLYEEAALARMSKSSKDLSEHSLSNDEDEDDDLENEPLYFNIMLLQDRALNRVQTWYKKTRDQQEAGNNDQSTTVKAATYEKPGSKNKAKRPFFINQQNPIPELKGPVLSTESVRSAESDSVFEDKQSWKNKKLLTRSAESTDSLSDIDDLSEIPLSVGEEDKLQMRKWVVTSILDSENTYLGILDVLMKYMTTFKNLLSSAQHILQLADIETIFYKIGDLHHAHKMFVVKLQPIVQNWNDQQEIAEIFKILALEEYKIAPEFFKNFSKAVSTIHKCWAENSQFADLTKAIKIKNMSEKPSLEELLHKPVLRFQRNSLVLHDLIKCTPTYHPDYDLLQKTLQIAQTGIENLDSPIDKDKTDNQRYLAKQGLVVEMIANVRKLRHIFLFNDLLVCARQKITTKQKIHWEAKWYISLIDLSLDDIVCLEEEKQLAEKQQEEIEQLQRKISELQSELKTEIKSSRLTNEAQRQWSFNVRSKSLDKIKKKLVECQAALIKASPSLMFRIHNRKFDRHYTILLASDYERSNWRNTITGLLSRATCTIQLSSADLQALVNSQKISKYKMLGGLIGFEDLTMEEEHLFGVLNIKIFKLQGLKTPSDVHCTIEVDTFGHFFMKAKTKIISSILEPCWDEDFEIELEGAQTVRFLCYKLTNGVSVLAGTCALELSKAWLRGDFQEKPISLNDELTLTISLRYFSRDQTLKRTVSSVKGGLFGAPIKTVVMREGGNVPIIVKTCITEVEKRGMKEIGIYRVSGVSGEIQRLKKAFEKNSRLATNMVKELDINVVTGTLKLYLRELPQALFTDSLYPQFVKGIGLSDPEAKEACITSLFNSLPEPNLSTARFLLQHLVKVSKDEGENKMGLQNICTVFGPTLLRPAIKETQQESLEELFSTGTREVMTQTNILYYIMLNIFKDETTF